MAPRAAASAAAASVVVGNGSKKKAAKTGDPADAARAAAAAEAAAAEAHEAANDAKATQGCYIRFLRDRINRISSDQNVKILSEVVRITNRCAKFSKMQQQ